MHFLDDQRLYVNTDHCLKYLRTFDFSPRRTAGVKLIFHAYWHGEFAAKQALSVKSFLATQDLDRCELWVWLDDGSSHAEPGDNPHLLPLIPLLTIKTWNPIREFTAFCGNDQNLFRIPDESMMNALLQDTRNLKQRSDIFRQIILYQYGGFYFDLDVLFLRDFHLLFDSLPVNEFCYQWSTIPAANSALLKLEKGSPVARYLLSKAISGLTFHPRRLYQFDDNELHLLVLPCAFFDPIWIHVDKMDICASAPFNSFKEFFTRRINMESSRIADFFTGSFAYHWHNHWKEEEELATSWAGLFDRHFGTMLQ